MAYVLGYFAADGCMSTTPRGDKRIDFESKDIDILDNVLRLTGYIDIKQPRTYNGGGTFVINFTNNGWYEELQRLGFTERKSLSLTPPAIPSEFEASFVRGFFDGDGHVTALNNRSQHSIGFTTGSLVFADWLQSILSSVIGHSTLINKTHKDNTYQVIISGKEKLRTLFTWLYKDSTSLTRMRRKYESFSQRKYMDCYIIPTLNDLDLMHKGHRYFCLAHFYIQNESYRNFFLQLKNNSSNFITLDNSAAEKSLVTEDALINIVRELKPNEVIAPDVLFDKNQTLINLESFIRRMKKEELNLYTSVFACPQGSTRDEWIQCYIEMLLNSDVSVIGLSKIAVPKCFGTTDEEDVQIMESRRDCIEYLIAHDLLKKPVHLLGMGNPTEYDVYSHICIRSTDSCYTVLAAVNEIDFNAGNLSRVKTTNDFYDRKLTWKEKKLAHQNIYFLKKVLRPQYYKTNQESK